MDHPVKAQAAVTYDEYKRFVRFEYFKKRGHWVVIVTVCLGILVILCIDAF